MRALDATQSLSPQGSFDVAIRSGRGPWPGYESVRLIAAHPSLTLLPLRAADRVYLAYFTPCRSGISPHVGPRFHMMPVQDFTACRSKISRQAGQDFTENQAGSF